MDLWMKNRPQDFWRLGRKVPDEVWTAAVKAAVPTLNVAGLEASDSIEKVLHMTLGEGQFGPGHWQLSLTKRAYYMVKPLIPRSLTRIMRRVYSGGTQKTFLLGWPIEDRYVRFLWETLRQVMLRMDWSTVPFVYFWPAKSNLALILTHDIETAAGQAYVRRLAEIEAHLGWRSSFNFIPERYPLDESLMDWLRGNGFEIGVHGLKHDGKEFQDYRTFTARVQKINKYIDAFEADGFRAPLTHRNPQWMQELNAAYDASFFDTDPFEPIAGGVMTIWPFILGRFIEMPYTLVQDYSLFSILGQTSERLWLEKVAFIERYRGMALINTHPDYLAKDGNLQIYVKFLEEMKKRGHVWSVLPAEAAAWWRKRSEMDALDPEDGVVMAQAGILDGKLVLHA